MLSSIKGETAALPLFRGGISSKVGPAPRVVREGSPVASAVPEPRRYVTVDGRLGSANSPNHNIWVDMSAARGWLRIIPSWLPVEDQDDWKLWMLGRTEFTARRTIGTPCPDPFVLSRTIDLRDRSLLENFAIGFEEQDGTTRRLPLTDLAAIGVGPTQQAK